MLSGVYEFLPQDRVIFGRPASEAVAETADRMAKRRLLIVASRTLNRKTDVVAKIRSALGDRCVGVFDECVEHVPRASVLALASAVRNSEPDLIVTVGGGTPIDTVKVMLLALAAGVDDEPGFDGMRIRVGADGTRVVPAIKDPPLRQIIVPTTLSGAEFSNLGGSTDPARKIKDLYTGRLIGGQVIILDPAVTVHTPPGLWLSTGIRAVDHAVETICSRKPQPFTDATCIHACGYCPNRCRPIMPTRPILPVASTASSRFGWRRPAWVASIGARATALVINSAPSPTCRTDIVHASCCRACCVGTAR